MIDTAFDHRTIGKFHATDGVCKVIYTRDDGKGGNIRVALWNQPGNDVTGMVARSQKVAGTFEKVCKFHSKDSFVKAVTVHAKAILNLNIFYHVMSIMFYDTVMTHDFLTSDVGR